MSMEEQPPKKKRPPPTESEFEEQLINNLQEEETDQQQDPVLTGAYYSLFYGSWANIEVKFLKKRVGEIYGLIVARACVFNSRIRLLTISRGGGGGEVDEESGCVIRLTRSVVAVPEYASLIIGAKLYDDDGELICRGKTAFAAEELGEETRSIFYNGVETLQVSVRWECRE